MIGIISGPLATQSHMKRKGMSLATWAFLIVTLVAVASVGVVAIQTHLTGQAVTGSRTEVQVTNSTTTSSLDGLRLSLHVEPTAVYQGSPITVSISDFNTHTTPNSPAVTGNLSIAGNQLSLGPCSQLPLGLGIYQGYLLADNLSSGSALSVFEPGIYSCPAEFPVAYYSFSPQSDDISLYSFHQSGQNQTGAASLMWTTPAAATLNFSGYWAGQSGLQIGSNFHPFAPGAYTVVGEDVWGQLLILHFMVSSGSGIVSTTSTTERSTSSTSAITSASTSNSTSVDSLDGLQLRVSMNATSLFQGQSLEVEVSEFNPLAIFDNVSRSDHYQVNVALGSCPNLYYQPFGVAVYRGYYDAQNVSQGVPLQIFPAVPCPMYVRLITGYTFQPLSDLAVIQPSSGATPAPIAADVNVSMVYLGQAQPLSPGTYTVVGADEWDALAFLYFQVL